MRDRQQTYQEALDYLYSFLDTEQKLPRAPAELNLPRTTALLSMCGEPQHAFPSIIIAGTKGKGSTAALIESIARAAGLRTGLWSSPHLHSYRERIQVNRTLISQQALTSAVAALAPLIATFDQQRYGAPTVFELGFLLALQHFATSAIDLAILEVGLGGRYDCANAITPILSVITSISYDHMHILGNHLGQIAYEKAGIMKPGLPTITIPQHPEAMESIRTVAAATAAHLWIVETTAPTTSAEPTSGNTTTTDVPPSTAAATTIFSIDPLAHYHGPTTTALRGIFQRENARLAIGAALLLRNAGLPISDSAISSGLATAQWPGRLEIIDGKIPIVIDGAHNADSAHKLVRSLEEVYPSRRLILILGTSQDKDIQGILAALLPGTATLILTRSRHPRARTDLEELATIARALLTPRPCPTIIFAPEMPDALAQAQQHAAPDHLICITGSLFVAAAARETLGLAAEKD